ncbi:MAG: hypothetical protein AAF824_03615 [Bacteroidota bacterium]
MNKWIIFFLLLLILPPGSAFSQSEIITRLEAETDSFYVGAHISFSLKVRYPKDQVVLLPQKEDSLSLFEWIKGEEVDIQEQGKWVKATQDIHARSFSLVSSQSLVLPYAIVSGKDTSWYTVTSAELYPIELIKGPPSDYLPKLYREWWEVIPPPNYTVFFLIGIGGIIILFTLYLVLRGPLIRWQQRRQIKKRWSLLKYRLFDIMNGQVPVDQKMYQFGQAWRGFLATRNASLLESKSNAELQHILPVHPWLEEPEKAALLSWNQRADEVIYAESTISTQEVQHQYETLLLILENAYKKQLSMMKKGDL